MVDSHCHALFFSSSRLLILHRLLHPYALLKAQTFAFLPSGIFLCQEIVGLIPSQAQSRRDHEQLVHSYI